MLLDLLVIDASAAIRKILQRVLKQAGVPLGEVYEAAGGLETLKVPGAQRVNLILADINMPNMDGLQLLRKLKEEEQWKGVPVIMVTTEGGQAKVMAAAELGAAGYIRKPFTADQIRHSLAAFL
jgi:two-component system, chemotaxis family, chemotaxis protein CheY